MKGIKTKIFDIIFFLVYLLFSPIENLQFVLFLDGNSSIFERQQFRSECGKADLQLVQKYQTLIKSGSNDGGYDE